MIITTSKLEHYHILNLLNKQFKNIDMGLCMLLECLGLKKSKKNLNQNTKGKYSKLKRNTSKQEFKNVNRFPKDYYENQILYPPYINPVFEICNENNNQNKNRNDKIFIEATYTNEKGEYKEFVEGTVCFPDSELQI